MEIYTKEQCVFIAEQYFKNNEDLATTVCNFRTKYNRNSNLISSILKRLIKEFRETESISDLKHPDHPLTSSTQNIEAVRESVAESPETLIQHHDQKLNLSRSSL